MKLFKSILISGLIFCFPAVAWADCSDKIRQSLTDFWLGGPFHYQTRTWNSRSQHLTAGKIIPETDSYQSVPAGDGKAYIENISIGGFGWEKDAFGWKVSDHSVKTYSIGLKESFLYLFTNPVCEEVPPASSDRLSKYTYSPLSSSSKPDKTNEAHTIIIDPNTGRIVRYERTGTGDRYMNMVSTFRFDPSIRISAPKIDLEKRKEKSLAHYNEAVSNSDQQCRERVVDILNSPQHIGPFKFRVMGNLLHGISSITGKFIPPSSMVFYSHGIPRHGGESEAALIDGVLWIKNDNGDWSKPKQLEKLFNLFPYLTYLPQSAAAKHYHIGSARCLDDKPTILSQEKVYEFELYKDQKNERIMFQKILMRVDATTGYPYLFETLKSHYGLLDRVEIRSYDPAIQISDPALLKNN